MSHPGRRERKSEPIGFFDGRSESQPLTGLPALLSVRGWGMPDDTLCHRKKKTPSAERTGLLCAGLW